MENMKRVLVKELPLLLGEAVKMEGWIHRVRVLKSVTFIMLRDRSGIVQCAFSPAVLEGLTLGNESVIRLVGTVVEQSNVHGAYEIAGKSIEILNGVTLALPITINGSTLDVQLDTLLNHRVLGLRHANENSIFKVQASLSNAFGSFLRENDFFN